MVLDSSGYDPDELARLRSSLSEAEARIQYLEQQLNTCLGQIDLVVESDRVRIAQAIHDGVAQDMALLLVKLEIASRLVDRDVSQVKPELSKVTTILETCVARLRAAVSTLRSPDHRRSS